MHVSSKESISGASVLGISKLRGHAQSRFEAPKQMMTQASCQCFASRAGEAYGPKGGDIKLRLAWLRDPDNIAGFPILVKFTKVAWLQVMGEGLA